MNKYLILITILTQMIGIQAYGQSNNDVLGALFDSQEDIDTSTVDPKFKTINKNVKKETSQLTRTCTSDKQTSLPLRMVLALLRGTGAKLVPSHNSDTGVLLVTGGPMIANCNSMLNIHIKEPNGNVPYSFVTEIKGCGKEKCSYDVIAVDKGVDETKTIEVEPTMKGFLSCLKQTGVYKDGKVVKGNVWKEELSIDKKGTDVTSKLVFTSRGPAAVNTGGAIFSKNNLFKNDSCLYHEDIQKDGFEFFSTKSKKLKNKMKEASSLCNGSDYEKIYKNLADFENIAGTYYGLEAVMQKDLLEKVKKAKKEMMEILDDEDKDLSDIDTEKYAQLFDDFYKLIVEKQLDEDSHNSADEQNPNLLVNLYRAYEEAESKEEKADIEKKIRDLSKKLSAFMEEPYFTPDDFKYFISMKRKAPLKDPKWKQATLSLQKSLVSLRASCQAYNVDNSSCKFSDSIKDMMEVDDLNKVISGYSKKIEVLYAKKEKVLKNDGDDESEFFAGKIRECKNLFSKSNKNKMLLRQYKPQFYQMAQSECQRTNQYASSFGNQGYYAKKNQKCIEEKVKIQEAKYYVSKTKLKLCDGMIDKYQAEYDGWSKLEKQRDQYYGSNDDDIEVDEVTHNDDGSYNFNYKPNQQPMKPWNQYPSHAAYNAARSSNGLSPSNGFTSNNTGFPMYGMNNYSMMGGPQYGYGSGQQQGFNSGYGFNAGFGSGNYSGYGRQPSYYGNSGGMYGGGMANGYGNYMNMPGAMQNYMGNSTMPGGSMNFTYGNT
jgi:hypothetical protein